MTDSPIRFGTDGWRAIIAQEFTFENVTKVVDAIGQYVQEAFGEANKPIVIGYDTRFMADQFAQFTAERLASLGFSTLLCEQFTPTPIVAFAAKHYDSAGAIMFTASHNPPEYLGIKYIPPYAGPATPEITNQLMACLANPTITPKTSNTPSVKRFNPFPSYQAAISPLIQWDVLQKKSLSVVYDAMYGAGQGYFETLLKQAGCQVKSLSSTRDPLFGNQTPEPKAAFLTELSKEIVSQKADVGFANDGDADRFGVVDETGRYLSANQILPLLLRFLYQDRGLRGSVVRTVATSTLLDHVAQKLSVTVHETPVGFKYVGERMRQEAVIIGGEESGGLSILGHIPEKDGLLANLLLAEMIATYNKPLSQIYQDLLEFAGVDLAQLAINLHLSEESKHSIMERIHQLKAGDQLGGNTIERIDRQDGSKLYFASDSWLLLRPSGTEPILRLYGESPSTQTLDALSQAIQAWIPDDEKNLAACH